MNLFILSSCPKQCAQWMFDVHVVKILLEAVQMLCTAKRILDPDDVKRNAMLYGQVHVNHPVSKWVRSSYSNYQWTLDICDALHDEWKYRYDHDDDRLHKAYLKVPILRDHAPGEHLFPETTLTTFAQAMPDEYKREDPIEAYRLYYMSPDKQRLASWRKRDMPDWYRPDPPFFSIRKPRQTKKNRKGTSKEESSFEGDLESVKDSKSTIKHIARSTELVMIPYTGRMTRSRTVSLSVKTEIDEL